MNVITNKPGRDDRDIAEGAPRSGSISDGKGKTKISG